MTLVCKYFSWVYNETCRISAPGPSCPSRCDGTYTVSLGDVARLPSDDHTFNDCPMGEPPRRIDAENTTWFRIGNPSGDSFVSTSNRLVFRKTRNSFAGQYSRSQYIQHVGECVTGIYSLAVTHNFCEFITICH